MAALREGKHPLWWDGCASVRRKLSLKARLCHAYGESAWMPHVQSSVFPSVCARLSPVGFLAYVDAGSRARTRTRQLLSAGPGRLCAAGRAAKPAQPARHLVVTGLVSGSRVPSAGIEVGSFQRRVRLGGCHRHVVGAQRAERPVSSVKGVLPGKLALPACLTLRSY